MTEGNEGNSSTPPVPEGKGVGEGIAPHVPGYTPTQPSTQPAQIAPAADPNLSAPTIGMGNDVPIGEPPSYMGGNDFESSVPKGISIKGKIGERANTQITGGPVAAPQQQIAPVSANGTNTSARESIKADMPAIASQTAGVNNPTDSPPTVPPAHIDEQSSEVSQPEQPPVEHPSVEQPPEGSQPEQPPEGAQPEQLPVEQPEETEQPPEELGVPMGNFDTQEEGNDPREEVRSLLNGIPGKMRLY